MSDIDVSEFEDLLEAKYPGSKKTRRMVENPPASVAAAEDAERWDAKPVRKTIAGKTYEFFTLGALAQALGRKPVTIRSWELAGQFPKARYRSGGDPQFQKRLYTRAQVEGVVRIAKEEGIFNITRAIPFHTTKFTEKVVALWKEPLS